MQLSRKSELKPLERFDFKPVQEPLDGLILNVDRDLQRRAHEVERSGDFEKFRQTTLLLIMLRVAANGYQALGFLLADVDPHPRRLARFVTNVPFINRPLMDLWFSLVYIADDFGPRSLDYELYAYRQMWEEINTAKKRYGADPEWAPWFQDMNDLSSYMEAQLPLTAEQKADPTNSNLIKSWPSPHALSTQASPCQDFLKLINELLYVDASIQAHLKPAGLLQMAGILLVDMAPEQMRDNIENRTIHQYKFRHFCRTVIALMGIISEIEAYCKLGNAEQALKVWTRLADKNPDAKDVFLARYNTLLSTP